MTVPFTTIDKLYINGEWIDSGPEREDVINPATETVIGRAPVGTAAAADAAIAAARTAFDDGPWPTMSMAERAAILRRMHAALDARRADIAALIVAEVGCAQGITHGMQVGAPLDHFLSALDHSTREEPIRLPLDITPDFMNPDAPKKLGGTTIVREPVGVVSGITGYNFPFLLNLAKIVPALLAGNTLVLKPSPFTPYSALLFGQIAEEIGLPRGVLNIITGGRDVGSLLTTDSRVDLVTFTGSEGVGAATMEQAAPTLKRVHLELGGKSELMVRPGAHIQLAAPAPILGDRPAPPPTPRSSARALRCFPATHRLAPSPCYPPRRGRPRRRDQGRGGADIEARASGTGRQVVTVCPSRPRYPARRADGGGGTLRQSRSG